MNIVSLTANMKKELWEFHKVLLWLPAVIAAVIFLALLGQYLTLEDYQATKIMGVLTELSQAEISAKNLEQLSKVSFGIASGMFVPFLLIAIIVQFYYFTGCLFDERRDLSVYFWRSLPVSDATAIGVKLFTGAVIVPAIFMLAATLTIILLTLIALIATVVLALGYDVSLWHIWSSISVFSSIFKVWLGLIPFVLWFLPVYAWFMLASMHANKAPFLWAIVPVALMIVIEVFLVDFFKLQSFFLVTTIKEYFEITDSSVQQKLATLSDVTYLPASVLVDKINFGGIAVAGILVYITYWLRVNRSHAD